MKKLRLYDHLGELVQEFNVFVEGEDFTWESSRPLAIWFGKIVLEGVEVEAVAPVMATPIVAEEKQRIPEIHEYFPEAFFHQPELENVAKETEEATHDVKATNNKGTGDSRTNKTKQSKDTKATPKDKPRGKAEKGNKGH